LARARVRRQSPPRGDWIGEKRSHFQPLVGAQSPPLSLALTEAPAIVMPLMRIRHDTRAKHEKGANAEGSDDEIDAVHEGLPAPRVRVNSLPHRYNAGWTGPLADGRWGVPKSPAMCAGRGLSSRRRLSPI